jgi:hypothetical protein
MNANKPASRRSLKSDLARVDAHSVKSEEYKEFPELNQETLARANSFWGLIGVHRRFSCCSCFSSAPLRHCDERS